MTILSGSLVVYGPRTDGGGVVFDVDWDGAHDDSETTEALDFLRLGCFGWSYGRYELAVVYAV
jgi:hypothetical protein